MKKDVLVLTKSKKYKGYCIAGIDIENGNWIRLNHSGHPMIEIENFTDCKGQEPEVLDTIRVNTLPGSYDILQPENVYIDNTPLEILAEDYTGLIHQRIKKDADCHHVIFHDTSFKITDEKLKSVDPKDNYSLIIIEPKDFVIKKVAENKIHAAFSYKDKCYWDFRITDLNFLNRFKELSIGKNVLAKQQYYIVLSLGTNFYNEINQEEEHYKLVAAIINQTDVSDEIPTFTEEYMEEEIVKDTVMTEITLLEFIAALKGNVDSDTGEGFEFDIFNDQRFQKILEIAEKSIAYDLKKKQHKLDNVGKRWSDGEDEQLKFKIQQQMKVSDNAKVHGDSRAAIKKILKNFFTK